MARGIQTAAQNLEQVATGQMEIQAGQLGNVQLSFNLKDQKNDRVRTMPAKKPGWPTLEDLYDYCSPFFPYNHR
jgi:hypothetical protein